MFLGLILGWKPWFDLFRPHLPPTPNIYIVGQLWIFAFIWRWAIEIWSILQAVRILLTSWDRIMTQCHMLHAMNSRKNQFCARFDLLPALLLGIERACAWRAGKKIGSSSAFVGISSSEYHQPWTAEEWRSTCDSCENKEKVGLPDMKGWGLFKYSFCPSWVLQFSCEGRDQSYHLSMVLDMKFWGQPTK